MMTKNCSVCKSHFDSYFWDDELRLVLCKSCKINWDKYERKKLPLPPDEWIDRFMRIEGPQLLKYRKIARHLAKQLKLPFFINYPNKVIIFRFEVLDKKMMKKLADIEGPITIGGNFISFWVEK